MGLVGSPRVISRGGNSVGAVSSACPVKCPSYVETVANTHKCKILSADCWVQVLILRLFRAINTGEHWVLCELNSATSFLNQS
jgi:hypothetical protein